MRPFVALRHHMELSYCATPCPTWVFHFPVGYPSDSLASCWFRFHETFYHLGPIKTNWKYFALNRDARYLIRRTLRILTARACKWAQSNNLLEYWRCFVVPPTRAEAGRWRHRQLQIYTALFRYQPTARTQRFSAIATLCCENVMNEHRWTDSGGDDIDDSAGDCGRRHHVTDDDECSRTRIVVDENEPEIGT